LHKWTRAEEEFIRENYGKLTIKQIATALGIKTTTVKSFLDRKGLRLSMEQVWRKGCKRQMPLLSKEQCIYLAGLIDGDGTIEVLPYTVKGKKYIHPVVRITNSSLFIRDIARECGFCIIDQCRERGNRVDTYVIAGCYGWGNTYDLLFQLVPYLKIRKPQAILVLRLIEKRKSTHFRSYADVMECEETKQILEQLRILNAKGKDRDPELQYKIGKDIVEKYADV
jgi:hypothetical protein